MTSDSELMLESKWDGGLEEGRGEGGGVAGDRSRTLAVGKKGHSAVMSGVWRGVCKNRKRRNEAEDGIHLGHTFPVLCNCRFLSIIVHIK